MTAAVGGESAGTAAGLPSRPSGAGLQIRDSTAELHWRPSTLALAVATCVATALAVAVIAGQWQVIVFAAPLVGLLGGVVWMVSPARSVQIIADPNVLRCFESEAVTAGVTASPIGGPAELRMTLEPADGLAVDGEGPPRAGAASRSVAAKYRISAKRWGRYDLSGTVVAAALGGMLTARATVPFAELRVYPLAAAQPTAIPRSELPDRIGTHLTRHHGLGVEYAGIRTYAPGDPLRSINWPVSASRGQLHITERYTDRAADVVALIDTYPAAPGPASAALERSARGATQVVQAALQRGDRAGVVALGGRPRWLAPDIGRRQFYRVLDTILDAGDGHVCTTGTLAPRSALPPGAIVVAFSTLLETDFALALIDLRKRGHLVVVVDVLEGAPFVDKLDPMTHLMWRLERKTMHRDMGVVGVDVLFWSDDTTLEQVMSLIARRPPKRMPRR